MKLKYLSSDIYQYHISQEDYDLQWMSSYYALFNSENGTAILYSIIELQMYRWFDCFMHFLCRKTYVANRLHGYITAFCEIIIAHRPTKFLINFNRYAPYVVKCTIRIAMRTQWSYTFFGFIVLFLLNWKQNTTTTIVLDFSRIL